MNFRRKLLVFILLVAVLGGGFAFYNYRQLSATHSHAHGDDYIVIPKGAKSDEIFAQLAAEGIIEQDSLLKYYVKLFDRDALLQAGEYRFQSPITPLEVLAKLKQGERKFIRLTVIEGWSRFEIAAAMAKIPELKLPDAKAALALMDDTTSIKDIDATAQNLEGYLYPDTYNLPLDTNPQQAIAMMTARFKQIWTQIDGDKRARASGKMAREIVTIASLIETEAKLREELPTVSSVIYNRLARGIPLGLDSAVIYASKLAGKWRNDGKVYQSDLDRDSPYNTRKVAGLPPGAISSTSRPALEAALAPANTDYLFYVREPSRNDGAHNFYSNQADFARGVQALRDWEKRRDAAPNNPQ